MSLRKQNKLFILHQIHLCEMKACEFFNSKRKAPFYSEVILVVAFTGPSDRTANQDACTAALGGPHLTTPRAFPCSGAKQP